MQTFLNICDLTAKASRQSRSEFTVSVPFHCYPLVVPNSPGLCLSFFFPLFSSFPPLPHLSSADRQPPEKREFLSVWGFAEQQWDFTGSQAGHNQEGDKTRRRGEAWGRTCSHTTIAPLIQWHHCAFLPSWPVSQNHSAQCRPLLSPFNYGMLYAGLKPSRNAAAPQGRQYFLTQINYTAWSTPGSEAWPAKYGWNFGTRHVENVRNTAQEDIKMSRHFKSSHIYFAFLIHSC